MLKGVHPLQGVQNRSRRTGRNFDDIRSRGNARTDLHTYLLTYIHVSPATFPLSFTVLWISLLYDTDLCRVVRGIYLLEGKKDNFVAILCRLKLENWKIVVVMCEEFNSSSVCQPMQLKKNSKDWYSSFPKMKGPIRKSIAIWPAILLCLFVERCPIPYITSLPKSMLTANGVVAIPSPSIPHPTPRQEITYLAVNKSLRPVLQSVLNFQQK